jgi:hypothetical protein
LKLLLENGRIAVDEFMMDNSFAPNPVGSGHGSFKRRKWRGIPLVQLPNDVPAREAAEKIFDFYLTPVKTL